MMGAERQARVSDKGKDWVREGLSVSQAEALARRFRAPWELEADDVPIPSVVVNYAEALGAPAAGQTERASSPPVHEPDTALKDLSAISERGQAQDLGQENTAIVSSQNGVFTTAKSASNLGDARAVTDGSGVKERVVADDSIGQKSVKDVDESGKPATTLPTHLSAAAISAASVAAASISSPSLDTTLPKRSQPPISSPAFGSSPISAEPAVSPVEEHFDFDDDSALREPFKDPSAKRNKMLLALLMVVVAAGAFAIWRTQNATTANKTPEEETQQELSQATPSASSSEPGVESQQGASRVEAKAPSEVPTTQNQEVAQEQQTQAAAPTVLFRVEARPADAKLTIDGRTAPLPLEQRFPKGTQVSIDLQASGFQPVVKTLTLDVDRTLKISLEPTPAPIAEKPSKVKNKRRAKVKAKAKVAEVPSTTKPAVPASESKPKAKLGSGFVTDNPY